MMQRWGYAAVAVAVLMSGHLDQAGAGSKKWWKRGCSGCSAPVMVGCHAPLSSCSGPSYGCGGCYAPTCGSPYGYQPTYMMPSCYSPSCSRPAFYAPNCAGCSTPAYGCSGPVYGCASPVYGCAAAFRPEYAPYTYMPSPYIQGYGYGATIPGGGSNFYEIGQGQTSVPPSDAYPRVSSYYSPVSQSIPAIPPLPPAEDHAW